MPAYNGAKFVSDAIKSILKQTFSDFEFLIIDDGSTDATYEIIRSYKDPRIHIVRNETNQGLVWSLNKGLDLARGNLVARMDVDDISLPKRLEKQVSFLETHPDYALVCSWISVIDEDKRVLYVQKRENKYLYYNLTFACHIAHPTVLFKRDVVLSLGMYDINCFAEDYELWSRLSKNFKIYKIDEPLVLYRQSGNGLSVKNALGIKNSTRFIVENNISYFIGERFDFPETFLDCYMGNCDPILVEGNLDNLVYCIDLLKRINKRIELTDNVNRNVDWVRAAGRIKLKDILTEYIKNIGIVSALLLIMRTNTLNIFILICWSYLKDRIFLYRRDK